MGNFNSAITHCNHFSNYCTTTDGKQHNGIMSHDKLRYRSNVTSHSLACIFLESRQALAQILRESSEESRLMLRTRLVELDHSREFCFVPRVINLSNLLQLDHSLELFV